MHTSTYDTPDHLSGNGVRARTEGPLAGLGAAVHDLESQSGVALREFAGSAKQIARQGADAARHEAARIGESSASYVRERPMRSVLMAAAAGGALVLVLGALTRAMSTRR